MSDFLSMGGYAWYVWMAYGGAALAIGAEIVAVRAQRRRALEELRMSAGPMSLRATSPSATGRGVER